MINRYLTKIAQMHSGVEKRGSFGLAAGMHVAQNIASKYALKTPAAARVMADAARQGFVNKQNYEVPLHIKALAGIAGKEYVELPHLVNKAAMGLREHLDAVGHTVSKDDHLAMRMLSQGRTEDLARLHHRTGGRTEAIVGHVTKYLAKNHGVDVSPLTAIGHRSEGVTARLGHTAHAPHNVQALPHQDSMARLSHVAPPVAPAPQRQGAQARLQAPVARPEVPRLEAPKHVYGDSVEPVHGRTYGSDAAEYKSDRGRVAIVDAHKTKPLSDLFRKPKTLLGRMSSKDYPLFNNIAANITRGKAAPVRVHDSISRAAHAGTEPLVTAGLASLDPYSGAWNGIKQVLAHPAAKKLGPVRRAAEFVDRTVVDGARDAFTSGLRRGGGKAVNDSMDHEASKRMGSLAFNKKEHLNVSTVTPKGGDGEPSVAGDILQKYKDKWDSFRNSRAKPTKVTADGIRYTPQPKEAPGFNKYVNTVSGIGLNGVGAELNRSAHALGLATGRAAELNARPAVLAAQAARHKADIAADFVNKYKDKWDAAMRPKLKAPTRALPAPEAMAHN